MPAVDGLYWNPFALELTITGLESLVADEALVK
jgi:hypothetical protein